MRLFPVLVVAAMAAPAAAQTTPSIDAQVTFLYYADVDAAAAFYEGVLGLEKTFDEGWVKIYRVSGEASVGLVDETRGIHRASDAKPVSLSIVTSEVDAWYAHLREAGVTITSELSASTQVPIRAFVAEDPGGYTVEFFEWTREGSND